MEQIILAEYFLSITPEVCYREHDQQIASQSPLEQLMLETDGPWPYSGQFTGRKTAPLFLHEMANKVAEIKEISIDQVKLESWKNTLEFFK